ncbi:hypothetical protein [uncultured Kocuria sp.]|uniref:hypothetical protein n=1 Tax=uncultured Kocuria sp. TaxID=259305 RepID=UPI002622D0B2|nr:hypothetical protein [uncultured Kocuria sp.]
MAKRISDLPELPISDGNDLIPIVDTSGNVTKRVSAAGLAQAVANNLPAASVGPAERDGGFKIGTIPASTFSSTGNKSITGLGFKPKLVKFYLESAGSTSGARAMSGAMDAAGSQHVETTAVGASGYSQQGTSTACMGWINAGSTTFSMRANAVSCDSDGFTIDVVSANGTFQVAYEAYG